MKRFSWGSFFLIVIFALSYIIPSIIISAQHDKALAKIPEYESSVIVNLPLLPDVSNLSDSQLDFLSIGFEELLQYKSKFDLSIDLLSFLLSQSNNDVEYYYALIDTIPNCLDEDLSNWYEWPEDCNNIELTKEIEHYCSFISSIYEDINSLKDELTSFCEYELSMLSMEKSIDSIEYISKDISEQYQKCIDLHHIITIKMEHISSLYLCKDKMIKTFSP